MRARSIILALVLLIACALFAYPLFIGSLLFAYPTGGASFYIGGGFLVVLTLIAAFIGTRRFFHR